jgi:hypothetical protein
LKYAQRNEDGAGHFEGGTAASLPGDFTLVWSDAAYRLGSALLAVAA